MDCAALIARLVYGLARGLDLFGGWIGQSGSQFAFQGHSQVEFHLAVTDLFQAFTNGLRSKGLGAREQASLICV